MEDKEIIKALSICYDYNSSDGCEKCPYYGKWLSCGELKAKDALDLINRQKAEIERYKNECFGLSTERDAYKDVLDEAVEGAIKEFAERLKNRFTEKLGDKKESFFSYSVQREIDKLVKEMTE